MPYYRFNFETPLSLETALARVRAITDDPGNFHSSFFFRSSMVPLIQLLRRMRREDEGGPRAVEPAEKPSPLFWGEVGGDSFRVRRKINYRNSFLPLVRGRIHPVIGGATVSVVMYLHPFVAAFMVFWLSAAVHFVWHNLSPARYMQFGMFLLFPIIFTCGAFFFEALKARRLLEDALK